MVKIHPDYPAHFVNVQSMIKSENFSLLLLLAPLDYPSHCLSKTVKGRRKPNPVLPLTGLRKQCIIPLAVQAMLLLLQSFLCHSSSFADRKPLSLSVSHKISLPVCCSMPPGIASSSADSPSGLYSTHAEP